MPRQPAPWKRKDVEGGPWYCRHKGKKHYLLPGDASKDEAFKAMRSLLTTLDREGRRPGGLTFRDVVNLFTIHVEAAVARGERAGLTLEGYDRYLIPAAGAFGKTAAAALQPRHVEEWLNAQKTPKGKPWGPTSRFNAITAVKAALNWARKSGHIPDNPLKEMERPPARRREEVLTPAQFEAVLSRVRDAAFRDLLLALAMTGCRPSEVYTLTADRVDLGAGTWTVVNKTRTSTGERDRTIYLSPAALELSRKLKARHPEGSIFRNRNGNPWTRNAVAIRLGRIGRALKLGPAAAAYSLRHLYCTNLLEAGVAPATVAELMGHKSLTMVTRVYSKLRHRTEHLKDAAAKAYRAGPTGPGGGDAPPPPPGPGPPP